MNKKFEWTEFYEEFANVLLTYKQNRKALLEKLKQAEKESIEKYGLTCTFNLHEPVDGEAQDEKKFVNMKDVDPFTVFSVFNRGLNAFNRDIIVKVLKETFSLRAQIPSSFDGVPSMFKRRAWFINFEKFRKANDIDILWDFFESALAYADDDENIERLEKFKNNFEKAINVGMVGKSNITIGLFWIRPDFYLSLDPKNEAFLIERNVDVSKWQTNFNDADVYLDILFKVKNMLRVLGVESFCDLSYCAHLESLEKRKASKQIKQFETASLESVVEDVTPVDVYDQSKFLQECYLDEEDCKMLLTLLNKKKNLILQGPPGVGKTFVAKRLAFLLMGSRDETRKRTVQFHQSYGYEDFVMGYKPTPEGKFVLDKGRPFYDFCKRAEADPQQKYVFIIDEINRGNLSKIFGELLMLIEADKRKTEDGSGESIRLMYSNEEFSVPDNLYIIGMMNKADRSLTRIDYALRRRFAFFDLKPAFDREGSVGRKFKENLVAARNYKFDRLVEEIKELNHEISNDKAALGPDFVIGHSYFCTKHALADEEVAGIVKYEILPLLTEYWFDNEVQLTRWSNRLEAIVTGENDAS